MILKSTFKVKPRQDYLTAERTCCYCKAPYEGMHEIGCVLRRKSVMVRAVVEYIITVPEDYTEESVLFQRNEGSWCKSNLIAELKELDPDDVSLEGGRYLFCFCNAVKFEFLRDATVQDHQAFPHFQYFEETL